MAVSCPLVCPHELWLEVLQRDVQQRVLQNYIWENYILPIFGEELYSRLLLVNNSCPGAKELPSPSRRRICSLQGAGEVAEEGHPACVHCGRGLLRASPRFTSPRTCRCAEKTGRPSWDCDVAALAAFQPQEECSTEAQARSGCVQIVVLSGEASRSTQIPQTHHPPVAVKPRS